MNLIVLVNNNTICVLLVNAIRFLNIIGERIVVHLSQCTIEPKIPFEIFVLFGDIENTIVIIYFLIPKKKLKPIIFYNMIKSN